MKFSQSRVRKKHFPPYSTFSQSKSHFPLELIHSDIWGPVPNFLISGVKFYMTFIDDYSRYCWIYPLTFKSQVFDVFFKFKALVENMSNLSNCRIKLLQTGGGGEYTSTTFKNFLTLNGISHIISCPHTPEQNGLAEHKHRHIVDMALALIAQSHVPK